VIPKQEEETKTEGDSKKKKPDEPP